MGPRGLLATRAVMLTPAILAAALCCAVLAPAASYAQGAVRVDALVGFNGTAREGRFTPVILSIENPGARARAQVTLEVTWSGPRKAPSPGWAITRDTVLDAGATRRIPFVIPLPRDARTLQAVVTSQGSEIGRFQADLRELSTSSRIIAGISSDLSFDALSAIGGGAGGLRVVYPRVDDLPQTWAGYDGVDAVIVHDTYFQQLRSDQVDALERWVVTGGVLVFTGGAAALQHEPAGFGPLLPVKVTGLSQRNGLPVAVSAGAVRRLPGRVEVAESTVTAGTVLAADGTLPVVVRRPLGSGSVWYLAFDPSASPASSWGGSLSMWRTILEGDRVPALGAVDRPAPSESAIQDPWIASLYSTSPASFPPVPALLVFLGAYVALLVPLLVSRSRRRMRGRTRLLLIAVVSVSACAAAWVAFNRVLFYPGLQAVDVATLQSRSDDGLAFVTEKVAWFSASALPAEARLGSLSAVLEAGRWRARSDDPWNQPHLVLSQAPGGTLVQGLDVQRMSSRLLVLQDVVPFSASVQVRALGSTVEATVRNGNARPILGCYILVSGRAYALGDVAAGASVRRTFSAADGHGSASDGWMVTDADRRRAALFKVLGGGNDSSSSPRLVGWMDTPALAVSVAPARLLGDRPGLALVSVESE